jgi:three-Cys-motif partner protein
MPSPYEDREQTAVKHRILERYLSAFVPIVGDWASDIAYIDCLAGPWQSVDPNLRDTSFGRAIDVLRSTRGVLASRGKHPTLRCLFVEKYPVAFDRLQQFCGGITDIETTPKAWDLTTHIQEVVQFARSRNNSFPFIFIDPKGWEVLEIALISPLLSLNPGEVLVTLMTSWITRFLPDSSKGFERIFGEDLPMLLRLQGEEQETEAVKSYANLVRRAGQFRYVCTLPVLKSDQEAFHFHMIYGTRHIKGVEVFKETEKTILPFMHETRAEAQQRKRFERTGQHGLFGANAQYRERKLTLFRRRHLETAKSELQKELESKERVLFDDAWATVMQYSTVGENDLREWLREWSDAGLVQITNQRMGQKFPRKGQSQYLKWQRQP